MVVRAVITINGKEYDVQKFEQCFYLNTHPQRGYPVCGEPLGGEIHILLATPTDTFLLDLMSSAWDSPIVEGELNVYHTSADMPVRRVTYRKALFLCYGDRFTTPVFEPSLRDGDNNMQTSVILTPREMIINKFVRISRSYSWRWTKVQEEELMPEVLISNPEMKLKDAYWLKEDKSQCRVFPIETRVTLYLVLQDFENFIGQELEFSFSEKTKEGVYTAEAKGIVPKDGIIQVEDFQFKLSKK